MSLTTEYAPTAIAQVQAAYSCTELEAITRMQGAAAADGDERSLEVLCAIKGKLIEAAHPVTTEVKAAALAVRVVRYCQERALTLDGLVAELDSGLLLDADRAKRLTTYCDQVQCLTLDGLVDEVWELRNEYHAAADREVIQEVGIARQWNGLAVRHAQAGYTDAARQYFKMRIHHMAEARSARSRRVQQVATAPAAPAISAFRNLYKIRHADNRVVAMVTAGNADGARGKYHGAGGNVEVVTAEQVSHGYPEDVCSIYE